METDSRKKWDELGVTRDEIDRIGTALKDENFRKLFAEYAAEISDPKNRELYEKEIAQMESDRGMDIQFIHPKPGHVIKVQVKSTASKKMSKAFINICQSEHLGKPSSQKVKKPDGTSGLQWSIPHSFSPAREDLDSKGTKCSVYDVVFHPDTYRMASNSAFLKMLHDTAIDGLERQFDLSIDRISLVRLKKLKFKGRAEPTVLRKKKAEPAVHIPDPDDPLSGFPYPYENGLSSEELSKRKVEQVEAARRQREEEEAKRENRAKLKDKSSTTNGHKTNENGIVVPEYNLTCQYGIDLSNFTQSLSGTPLSSDSRPTALVITISLPTLNSAASCQLDVTERLLKLESCSPVRYNLSIKLPYPVDEVNGTAKFDKAKKTLVVTLPVVAVQACTTNGVEMQAEEPHLMNGSPLIQELSSHSIASQEGDVCATSFETNNAELSDPCTHTGECSPWAAEASAHNSTNLMKQPERCAESCSTPSLDSLSNSTKIVLDSKLVYRVPGFTFDQDEECVTLVLDVPHVDSKAFKSHCHINKAELLFTDQPKSGFPFHYYLVVEFDGPISELNVSVGDRNVVVNIVKAPGSDAPWESFIAGQSADNMTTYTFLTETLIRKELAQLEELAQIQGQLPLGQSYSNLVVKMISKEQLTIDVQPNSDTISKDIPVSPEVIHKTQPPTNIQGILKNRCERSISESGCDDLLHFIESMTTQDQQADNELPSPRERKKSVSFSHKVEETKFVSTATVCQLHKTLHNRKKNQRRRKNSSGSDSDGRKTCNESGGEGRRRHSSLTSENSSGDDCPKGRVGKNASQRLSSSDDAISSTESLHDRPPSRRLPSAAEMGQGCVTGVGDGINHNTPSCASPTAENRDSLNSDDDDVDCCKCPNAESPMVWQDKESIVEKTKCPFDFSNSVIFDLDD